MSHKNSLKLLLVVFLLSLNSPSFPASKSAKAEVKKDLSMVELANFRALDFPYDNGESGLVVWDIPLNEVAGTYYQIFVSSVSTSAGWIKAEEFKAGEKTASTIELPFWVWDKKAKTYAVKLELNNIFGMDVKKSLKYYARVQIVTPGKMSHTTPVEGEIRGNWFRLDRLNNLVMLIIITTVFFIAVSHAKRKGLFIRRIAGLDAIDEAIGRATEMGKPIFYVPGIGSMASISTIASTFILGEVSKKVAQYDSYIKVPHYDPIVMAVSKEIVRQSYMEAERPDSYREDINQFISSDQFSYAATIDGMITREKPAACFFMGYFMAESLLLAEVGASTGAIQIAGTDVEHQLPFFFTACDYTLIGEELYAAGAYLSKEPMLLSVLKVQDFGKLFVMVSVALSSIGLLIAARFDLGTVTEFFTNLLKVY